MLTYLLVFVLNGDISQSQTFASEEACHNAMQSLVYFYTENEAAIEVEVACATFEE